MYDRSSFRSHLLAATALAFTASAFLPATVLAQEDADFLFKRPRVTLGFNVGYATTNDSDIFQWYEDVLTMESGDFSSTLFGGELAIRATERLDVTLGVMFARGETTSEYIDWVGTDDLPILQTTEFTRIPFVAGVKYYLWDRGRSIGRFAWIPREWAPYVGGGLGVTHYTFEQEGEWVDLDTLDILYDQLVSDGSATTGFVRAGADLSLTPRLFLNVDGRYSWASTELDTRYFEGFDDIDLGGFDLSLGIAVRL